jgi:hypothetical protein
MPGGNTYPTAPTGPPPSNPGGSNNSGTKTQPKTPGTKDGSKDGSKGGGGTEADYRADAAARYRRQAENLEAQAAALRHALKIDFKQGLQTKLSNINLILRQSDNDLLSGYRDRYAQLKGSAEDNAKAQSTQTMGNISNHLRERSDAMSEVAAQGAGESDALAAQMMSLRNWNANQSEIQRSNFDTLRSINSGLTDLNVDTATNRKNLAIQALADKEMLWTNYFNQRSEAWTQLGNIRGQQADYYDMAKEYGGKGDGGQSVKQAERAFMQGAKELGNSWENPGLSKKLRKWDGRPMFEASNTGMSKLQAAPTVDLGERPEGATLRTW